MFLEITGIDLFDLNVGMPCANVRLRCAIISLSSIYLIKNRDMACVEIRLRCSWISLGIDLFDQNVGMACANVRFRCS